MHPTPFPVYLSALVGLALPVQAQAGTDLVVGSAETRGVNVYRNVSPAVGGTR